MRSGIYYYNTGISKYVSALLSQVQAVDQPAAQNNGSNHRMNTGQHCDSGISSSFFKFLTELPEKAAYSKRTQ